PLRLIDDVRRCDRRQRQIGRAEKTALEFGQIEKILTVLRKLPVSDFPLLRLKLNRLTFAIDILPDEAFVQNIDQFLGKKNLNILPPFEAVALDLRHQVNPVKQLVAVAGVFIQSQT